MICPFCQSQLQFKTNIDLIAAAQAVVNYQSFQYYCPKCPNETFFNIVLDITLDNFNKIVAAIFIVRQNNDIYHIKCDYLSQTTHVFLQHPVFKHPKNKVLGLKQIASFPLLSITPYSATEILQRLLKNKAFL